MRFGPLSFILCALAHAPLCAQPEATDAWAHANTLAAPGLRFRQAPGDLLIADHFAHGKRVRTDSIAPWTLDPDGLVVDPSGSVWVRCLPTHPRCLVRTELREDRVMRTSAFMLATLPDGPAAEAVVALLRERAWTMPVAETAAPDARTNSSEPLR
jgi:hypothetical protein